MPLNTIPNKGLTSRGYPSDRLVTPIIINGDMSVAQRGTSATGITSTSYNTVDRYRVGVSGFGTWTQSQDTDVPTGEGFAKSLKMDCTTASGPDAAGSVLYHVQYVEAQNLQMLKFGTSNAEYITLAFWVKTNITGTYTVEIESPDNGRHICGTYTVNSSNTWEKKILSFPGDTTGSITNDNGRGFEIFWWLGAGSEFTSGTLATSWASQTAGNRVSSSQANIASSTDNNFWITGVQLEVGEFDSTTIPSFPFESFENNLRRCQRYYQKSYNIGTTAGTATSDGIMLGIRGNGAFAGATRLPVVMRTTPTLTIYSNTTGASGKVRNAETGSDETASTNSASDNSFNAQGTTSGISNVYQYQYVAEAEL
jgi:hypothetical protein